MKKILLISLFILIWLGLLAIGPYTGLNAVSIPLIKSDFGKLITFLLKISGLILFTLLFIQIVLGGFLDFWGKVLGKWIYKFHIFQGLLTSLLIVLHPLFLLIFRFLISKKIDPFYIYTDVCVLCENSHEFYLNFGRIAFWLILITTITAILRFRSSLFKTIWRKLHLLNYLIFFLILIHLQFGSLVIYKPFSIFYPAAALIVVLIIVFKLFSYFKSLKRIN